jgi:replicative DNA helicase
VIVDRKPPHDPQAELGTLGSFFVATPSIARTVLPEVAARLDESDFFDDANAAIWGQIKTFVANKRPLDPIMFVEAMKTAGTYEKAGGAAYLSQVINAVPNSAHVTYYADIVAEKSFARRVITEATKLLTAAYDETQNSSDLATHFETSLNRLTANRSGIELPVAIGESLRNLVAELRRPLAAKQECRASFGIQKVDEIVGAIHGGETCIIAARPGMGKTAFVTSPLRFAAQHNRPSLLISLEMENREIAGREASRGTGIDNHFIRSGDLDDIDLTALENFAAAESSTPFYTWSTTATLAQIRAMLIQAKNKLGITVAAIDYIGLIKEPPNFRGQRRDHLAEVSRGLKRLAKELGIPLFILAQLNREKERPNLTMLAECGAIEQDADSVIMLHAAETSDPTREVIVAKFRAGQTGKFEIGWDGKRFNFTDPDNSWQP